MLRRAAIASWESERTSTDLHPVRLREVEAEEDRSVLGLPRARLADQLRALVDDLADAETRIAAEAAVPGLPREPPSHSNT